MKYRHLYLFSIILLVFLASTMLESCSYYRKSTYPSPVSDEFWRTPDGRYEYFPAKKFQYVLHTNNTVSTLKDVKIDLDTDSLWGEVAPFEGSRKALYENVQYKNVSVRSSAIPRNYVKQVHLFVNKDVTDVNNTTMSVKLSDITRVEVLHNAGGMNILLPVGVAVVAFGVFLVIACNCPHVYIHNGEAYELNTSLYTGAVSPYLERQDFKEMPDYFPDSTNFTIQLSNEESEDQHTNLLQMTAVYHPADVAVYADRNGNIHTATAPYNARIAVDNDGRDLITELTAKDDLTYEFNPTKMTDLSDVYLTFDAPAHKANGNLLLNVRNTNWSGIVYDQFNAKFGKKYTKWADMNKDKSREEREQWMREQGVNLLVELKTENGWEIIDKVELVGEYNANTIAIPLENIPANKSVEIRLRSGYMFWSLDYAAIDFSTPIPVEVVMLKASEVMSTNGMDYTSALAEDDTAYMSHLEGAESVQITFEPKVAEKGQVRSLFLHSKGYYEMHKEYTGKMQKKDLAAFKTPGELSRFSKSLYADYLVYQQSLAPK